MFDISIELSTKKSHQSWWLFLFYLFCTSKLFSMKPIISFFFCLFISIFFAQSTVTDIDGNSSDFLHYGTLRWTVENAEMETYTDGTPIPQVTDSSEWSNLTTGAWCYYNNDPSNGKLYNWYAVAGIHDNDPNTPNKKLAPNGWYVPNEAMWFLLRNYLISNGYNYDGTIVGNKVAKSMASQTGWDIAINEGAIGNNQNNNNSSGFSAFPDGIRSYTGDGSFSNKGSRALFWSYDVNNPDIITNIFLQNIYSTFFIYNNINLPAGGVMGSEQAGYSVRFFSVPAPIGSLNQAFCDTATVADLSATGENIQWYDSLVGGDILNVSEVIADGQVVYASQTIGGFESVERLEVIVGIQNIQISSTATEVCEGESVNLSVEALGTTFQNNFCSIDEIPITLHQSLLGAWPFCGNASDISGNNFNGTLNGGVTPGVNRFGEDNNSYIFDGQPLTYISMGTHELLDITQGSISISAWVNTNNVGGTKTILSKANTDTSNVFGSYTLHLNGPANFIVTNSTSANSYYSVLSAQGLAAEQWKHLTAVADIDELKLRLYFDGLMVSEIDWEGTYKGGVQEFLIGSHYKSDFALNYMYNFNGSIDDVAIWNRVLNQYEIDYLSMSNSTNYLWSTGDISENITVTPTETTEYWVDVTTNGVTCREYVTINVTAPAAPTGDAEQTFCDAVTVADLTVTGENIQWYDAATGGNLLDSTTALTDGQMVYASQTVNGCESTDRLEVTVSIQDITITASATEVCTGESVDLTVSSGLIACTSTELKPNLQTGLVGYWPFCGNANDESGNGNNGTVTGAILTTDRFGNANSAYNFGQNIQDYIILPPSNNYENDNISFSFWINPSQIGQTQGWNTIIKKGDFISAESEAFIFDLKPSTNGYDKFEVGYKTACEQAGDGWQKNQYDLNENLLNNWTNFVVTLDSSNNQTIYKNGALISQTLIDGNYNSCTGAEISIGSEWGQGQPLFEFYGSIDDIAIWDRVLSETEVQQLAGAPSYTWSTGDTTETISVTPTETTEYWVDVTTNGVTCREYITIDVTSPAAPTGDSEQTFCEALTVADLTATGDNIQWYDAATGGNLLDSTTALTDGQMVYASQTVNGCESTERLEVTVFIQDITITASATEVCSGESVDLSVVGDVNSTYLWSTGESNFSGQGTLVDEYSLVANTVSQNTFSIIPGNIYRLEVSGTISLGGGAGNQRDVAYYIQSGSDGTVEGTPFDSECNLRIWTSLFCENPGLRPSPDIYDPINHTYSYPFTSNSSSLEVGFWDSPLVDNGPNVVTFKLYELSNSESIITVNPTETTEYWVDVTNNGVTCREYITIDVTAPAAPTGNSVQGGCSDFSVGSNNNAFTGENLQWYAAPSGGTALPDSHLLVDGTYYYISQTVDGCESSDRFEFLYLAPQPTITIDSPVICEGDSTTVSISSSPSFGTATFLWNTGENSDSITLSPTESTTFWVDQIYSSGGPENIQTVCRYFFGINVDNAPEAPISGGDITECETNEAQNLVATASANAGESITWYDAATGGNVVANPSLGTAGTVTFFAEATNDNSGCASLTRTALILTITSVTTPTGDAVQSFCDNVNVSDLSAVGSNIQWYDADTGGNILDSSSPLTDGEVLYASQTQNGCESITRLEVSVEIDVIPDPILINTELEFCLAREAILADLELDEQGFALEWYDSFNGGNILPMDTLLEDGISYYTTLYDAVSGCESLMRLEVVPTVIPCEVIIYNALSLNNNGINDYMVIENVEYFPENSLEVFNRDGHLIYYQKQYGVGDNLFKGVANVNGIYGRNSNGNKKLPTGSYLYVFNYFNQFDQQQYTLKGFLTINSN